METQILLCVIKPDSTDCELSEFDFYSIVQDCAVVKNVKIFDRNVLFKAFVQVEKEYARKCVDELHEKKLEIGILRVYLSYKKDIVFDRTLQSIINEAPKHQRILVDNDVNEMGKEEFSPIKHLPPHVNPFDPFYDYEGSNQLANKTQIQNFSSSCMEDSFKGFYHNTDPVYTMQYNDYRLSSPDSMNTATSFTPSTEFIPNAKPYGYSQNKPLITGKVIMINRASPKATCLMLMNLFGCFGNIKKLLFNKEKRYCMIEFDHPSHSQLAIKYLNNVSFLGMTLKVKQSNYPYLNLKNSKKDKNNHVKILRGHYKYFRYKSELNIKVNKPSKVLHFTSLSSKFSPATLFEFIQKIHTPVKIVKLSKNGLNSSMFLISFAELHESFEVLSMLHNTKIDGKLMKVSFSNAKVE